ncbi:FadR family transcriptional regulator [Peteryoungia desertarenae]|uniref:FadR family transcriptional regulator n=1 Tax=Peteryoungia desertarenae TaxID=1813451 RepID=A0ABX6QQF0_9HYPH|nr:FadR/GntR family transcriptional regulator [Peteryoungia desertarenae]QLF70440.1 FadR family transcriptional regulator [Peteryoungia desertarenae]
MKDAQAKLEERAVKLRTSHSKVVEQIGSAIVSGRFPTGEALPGDAELEYRYGVSRSVLREVMKTLAAKRMIVPKSRIGTKVTPRKSWNMLDADVLRWHFMAGVSPEFIHHLYDGRLVLEPAGAEFAARKATDEQRVELRRLAEALGDPQFDLASHVQADLRFHLQLLIMSGNIFIRSMSDFVVVALEGAFQVTSTLNSPGRYELVRDAHMLIVDAIDARDPAGAREATHRVIEMGRERALLALEART